MLVSPAQLLREAELRAAVECSKVTKAELVAELQSAYFQCARVVLESININLRNFYDPEADHSLAQCTGHKMKSACLRARTRGAPGSPKHHAYLSAFRRLRPAPGEAL